MTPPPMSDLVYVHLPLGRDHAATIGVIQERLGVSRRVIERAIEELRQNGEPVISCAAGVYVSRDAAEIRACAERLDSRVRQQYATVRAMRATARRFERAQQMEMFG